MSRLNLKLAQAGNVKSALGDVASNDIAEQNKRTYTLAVSNSCALNNVDESPIVQVLRDCTVKAVRVIVPSSLQGNDSNGKIITITHRVSGGANNTIATANTGTNVAANGTNGLTAFVGAAIAITNTLAAICSANDVITFKAINMAAGVTALSTATSTAIVEVDVEEDNR